jgi:hypothetical protein
MDSITQTGSIHSSKFFELNTKYAHGFSVTQMGSIQGPGSVAVVDIDTFSFPLYSITVVGLR